jgi:AraC-like DNA-binding protein
MRDPGENVGGGGRGGSNALRLLELFCAEAIAEIAADVGYRDVAAFGCAFKALVGESPARWRTAAAG